MSIKARGELLSINDNVNLTVQFYDTFGNPANTDFFPQVSMIQPSGLVALPFTSAGVSQINVGQYNYQFTIPYNGPFGVWNDIWQGSVNGTVFTNTLSFVVSFTDLPAIINSDGYYALGDDVGFDYSQRAIFNINKLLKGLKARLNNNGKSQSTDSYGNIIYIDCNVFADEMLVAFLADSISNFNQIPYFTFFTFEDDWFVSQFFQVLVEGATYEVLASVALIEKGREYTINDNGVSFTPPQTAELLASEFGTILTNYWEKLKMIKASMRPAPLGLGTLRPMAVNPIIKNLSLLRERRLF